MTNNLIFPSTRVLTKGGKWKDISMLQEGDKTLSIASDGRCEWTSVDYLGSNYYDGYVSERISRSFSTRCADGGEIITKVGKKVKSSSSKSLSKNHRLIGACILDEGEYHLSDLELQLAGWLCTDSHFTKGNQAVLYQRESNVYKITDILNTLNIAYSYQLRVRDIKSIMGKTLKKPPENGVEVTLDIKDIRKLGVSSNKHLPVWCSDLSKRQWDIFLETLIEADGSIPTKSVDSRVFYGRDEICEHLQAIAITKGWCASITEYRPSHFRVNLLNNRTDRRQDVNPSAVTYKGVVYTVKNSRGNMMVKIDNKPVFIAI